MHREGTPKLHPALASQLTKPDSWISVSQSKRKGRDMTEYNTSLQPVTPADKDFLCTVYASTREEEMELSGWDKQQISDFLGQQFHYQHTYYQQEFPEATYSLILVNNERAGRLYLDRREKEHRIIDIALLPRFQRKGIGSKLLKEILEEANQAGKSVGIHVEQNNPALHLYNRLGFVKTGEQGLYFLMEWNARRG